MAASRATSRLQHHMPNGKDGTITVNKIKKERKRLQNRLNQRARRLRIHQTKSSSENRPYRIDRWRFDEPLHHASSEYEKRLSNHTILSEPSPENTAHQKAILDGTGTYLLSHDAGLEIQHYPHETGPTFPADHLLTLIQFNVLRALRTTKDVLWQSTLYSMPGHVLNPEMSEDVLFSRAVITHASNSLPSSLAPVQSQTSLLHFVWVDLVPFPTMREKFITWENQFNHAELVNDLVGDLVDTTSIPETFSTTHPIPYNLNLVNAADDEITSSRNGLIVWGEPHLVDSWEATPGFLRKWGWAVQGCHDLIESSNRWRVRRGEEPFRVST